MKRDPEAGTRGAGENAEEKRPLERDARTAGLAVTETDATPCLLHDPAEPPALGEACAWRDEGGLPAQPPLVESGRSGPLADLLYKEGVEALRAELEQRSGEVARLRGALADVTAQLEARTAVQASLQAAHDELREELRRLIAAVAGRRAELERRTARLEARVAALGSERDELRRQLATAQVSRDAAVGEAAGLREELERLGGEVAAARERAAAREGNLGEAQRLLAEARALTRQLHEQESVPAG